MFLWITYLIYKHQEKWEFSDCEVYDGSMMKDFIYSCTERRYFTTAWTINNAVRAVFHFAKAFLVLQVALNFAVTDPGDLDLKYKLAYYNFMISGFAITTGYFLELFVMTFSPSYVSDMIISDTEDKLRALIDCSFDNVVQVYSKMFNQKKGRNHPKPISANLTTYLENSQNKESCTDHTENDIIQHVLKENAGVKSRFRKMIVSKNKKSDNNMNKGKDVPDIIDTSSEMVNLSEKIAEIDSNVEHLKYNFERKTVNDSLLFVRAMEGTTGMTFAGIELTMAKMGTILTVVYYVLITAASNASSMPTGQTSDD
jgi:hypothetical protein